MLLLQGCCKDVARVLQGCYKDVTRNRKKAEDKAEGLTHKFDNRNVEEKRSQKEEQAGNKITSTIGKVEIMHSLPITLAPFQPT